MWRRAKTFLFLNRQLPITTSIFLQSLNRDWTLQYTTRIILFRDIRLSGKRDRGPHRRGGELLVYVKNIYKACVIEKWSSVSETNFQQLWLKVQSLSSLRVESQLFGLLPVLLYHLHFACNLATNKYFALILHA